ncbi:GNAT family N-acetyltransferase [Psychroserpens sp. MEBiC05023]
MNIQHIDSNNKGEFFYEVNGEKLGLMTYSHTDSNKIIIDHTEVDKSLKGQGVGYALVEASVNYARAKQIKILPLCPFATAVFRKKIDYSDVLF